MLKLVLIADYTPEGNEAGIKNFTEIHEKSYIPFINIFEEFDIPAVHCINSHTLQFLKNNNVQTFLDKISQLYKNKRVELAHKGYSDACFSYLPERDIRQQLIFCKDINNLVWDVPIDGFLPIEGYCDPLLVKLLKEMGWQWITVSSDSIINNYPQKTALNTFQIPGISPNETINSLCYFEGEAKAQDFSQKIKNIFLGKIDVKKLVNEIFHLTQNNELSILAIKFSMEYPLLCSNPLVGIKRFRFFLECLESVGLTKIDLPGNIFNIENKKNTILLEIPYERRLNILLQEARDAIREAELKNISKIVINKAWKKLLLAEDYSATKLFDKANCQSNFTDNFNRYIQACQKTIAAKLILSKP